jgi:hypothetical protein
MYYKKPIIYNTFCAYIPCGYVGTRSEPDECRTRFSDKAIDHCPKCGGFTLHSSYMDFTADPAWEPPSHHQSDEGEG